MPRRSSSGSPILASSLPRLSRKPSMVSCVSATGLPSSWAAFVASWTTGVAFTTATVYYQAATFNQHPVASTSWILGLALAVGLVVAGLRFWSRRGSGPRVVVESV